MSQTTALADRHAQARPDDLIALTRAQLDEIRLTAFRAGMRAQLNSDAASRPFAATG